MSNPFEVDGNWYKGNLHTHTTVSDGSLSPQETIQVYAEGGYDFLALTDHDCVVNYAGLEAHGMALISGVELGLGAGNLGQQLHVVALGLGAVPQVPATSDYAENVAAIAQQCELCFVAHPFWSLLTPGETLPVLGHIGVEVYNATCQTGCARGPAEYVWDILLANGQRMWGFAVDDAHHPVDYRKGWVMVKAVESSPTELVAALRRGDFYSSNGPEVYDVKTDGEEITVRCSPCQQVGVIEAAPGVGITTDRFEAKPPFEEVRLPRQRTDCSFRVEVIDERGCKAWTNPVFPEEIEP